MENYFHIFGLEKWDLTVVQFLELFLFVIHCSKLLRKVG